MPGDRVTRNGRVTFALRDADLDMERCTARVLHGKGNKSRIVVLDRKTIEMVQEWIERRTKLWIVSPTLFCTLSGGMIDAGNFSKGLKLRARKAGIVKRVHPHGLRHSGASRLAQEGYNLQVIQQELGHSSPSSTDRYLRALNPVDLVNALKDREW